MLESQENIWITGIGLVSSLGEGHEAHWDSLASATAQTPVVDSERFAPYPVHPLVELDYSQQIPRRGDQRQMGPWQRLGTYAAGLALSDAGIAGQEDYLKQTHLIVAAGGGERDIDVDAAIMESVESQEDPEAYMNGAMLSELRPTLFLAQLSNLLAGNISIVHGVIGSSRTFMGEEMAGVSALEVATKRIGNGQADIALVGGAYNSERLDMMLLFELNNCLRSGNYAPIWERLKSGGGLITGSVGAFLVLESESHAKARGAKPYAKISNVMTDRCDRSAGAAKANAQKQFDSLSANLSKGPLAVVSGASGEKLAAEEELAFWQGLEEQGYSASIRAGGSVLGHSVEAQFPASVALAALAASKGKFFDPFDTVSTAETPFEGKPEQILVSCWGSWRGEGMALVEAVTEDEQ